MEYLVNYAEAPAITPAEPTVFKETPCFKYTVKYFGRPDEAGEVKFISNNYDEVKTYLQYKFTTPFVKLFAHPFANDIANVWVDEQCVDGWCVIREEVNNDISC